MALHSIARRGSENIVHIRTDQWVAPGKRILLCSFQGCKLFSFCRRLSLLCLPCPVAGPGGQALILHANNVKIIHFLLSSFRKMNDKLLSSVASSNVA